MTSRRRNLLLLIGGLLLSVVFFHQLTIGGGILARGDTRDYFYPYWDARNAAFRALELPLWSNDLFMGIPLLANPQLGVYYPPNWLTAPLRAPAAISLSIILHTTLAAAGACWLYREAISPRWLPACTAAIIYAFSGALGAHVEQINQLQGLAWMPLLFALAQRLLTGARPGRAALLLAVALALQIFSGHTQTVYISAVGLGAFTLAISAGQCRDLRTLQPIGRAIVWLAAAAGGALLLALPQLLPSLELLSLSNRNAGFSAQHASAFSLPIHVIGRSLLPGYDGQLFGEYIAYIGVIGLGLALWGALARPLTQRGRWIWLLLAALGLAFALGSFNPLYPLIAQLPGFVFFRVPARFLALTSLALALLAGLGVEALGRPEPTQRVDKRRILLIAAALVALIGATRYLLQPDPILIFGDSAISDRTLALWLGAAAIVVALLVVHHRRTPLLALVLVTAELFLASLNLPYNDVSPPDVYLDQRATVSQLRAFHAEEDAPGRTLAISQIRFDPLDIAELRERFGRRGMGYVAQFHALDAIKKQEMLLPNFGLTWGIPSIDGFGGGITPTRYWTLLSQLLLPLTEQAAVDGRLGSRLALETCRGACLPERRWLEFSDTRYLITDKLSDVWHEGIRYDTTLSRFWGDVATLAAPDERYDQARVLHRAPIAGVDSLIVPPWDDLLTISDIAGLPSLLRANADIIAVTLVDSRQEGVFVEMQPPGFERVVSSAIEVYRHAAPSQRAYLAGDPQVLPDDASSDERALQLLREGATTLLHGVAEPRSLPPDESGVVSITSYSATSAKLQVDAPAPAWLILRDAFYPGWQATVKGRSVPITRANLLFRAVPVPAGESSVEFRFEPHLWYAAIIIGGALWLLAGLLWWRLQRNPARRYNGAEINSADQQERER